MLPWFCSGSNGEHFCDVEDAEVYIGDIGAFSNSWEEHKALLRKTFTLLQDNVFTVNPLK